MVCDLPISTKKGPDGGIDGYLRFFDSAKGKAKKVVIQVKSGHVGVSQIRDLIGVLTREKADFGVFVTLEAPTKPMMKEAIISGFTDLEVLGIKQSFPKIQILTVDELLKGNKLNLPVSALSHQTLSNFML